MEKMKKEKKFVTSRSRRRFPIPYIATQQEAYHPPTLSIQ